MPNAGQVKPEAAASPGTAKRRARQPTLDVRVLFDTSVLWTDSPSDLLQVAVEQLVKAAYKDLRLTWYVPHVVRHERQYQMVATAVAMLPRLRKLQDLMGFSLDLSDEVVHARIQERIDRTLSELEIVELPLDVNRVDWGRVILDAVCRRLPFQSGGAEKGFRDCVVLETFIQLVENSASSRKACRLVLVSADDLLRAAVSERTKGRENVHVFDGIEDVRNLLYTISSEVGEEFIEPYRLKANTLFYEEDEDNCVYVSGRVRSRIEEQFGGVLRRLSQGATDRRNGGSIVHPPTFISKKGQRVHWSTRIEVNGELTRTVVQTVPISVLYGGGARLLGALGPSASTAFSTLSVGQPGLSFGTIKVSGDPLRLSGESPAVPGLRLGDALSPPVGMGGVRPGLSVTDSSQGILPNVGVAPATRAERVGTVRETFDVLWSTTISSAGKLVSPKVDDVKHVETDWQTA